MLSARRGVDRKAGRFLSPRLRVLPEIGYTGNADRRGMEPPITDRRCENSVHSLQVSAHFIGARTIVSSWKHFIRSAGRSASCAAVDDRKNILSARRGVDRKAGRFSSPRLRVLSLELSLHKQRKRSS